MARDSGVREERGRRVGSGGVRGMGVEDDVLAGWEGGGVGTCLCCRRVGRDVAWRSEGVSDRCGMGKRVGETMVAATQRSAIPVGRGTTA